MEKKKGKLSKRLSTGEGIPEAKYTRFGEQIRRAIPGPVQCSVGCGGRNCKWENPARWNDEDQAIKGVFSSWVLEDVVAMSRPSTGIIKKYKIIEQFKKHNICSIINLQRPGEHASCGPPLDKESLFTYRPQEFMDNDIFFYNFGWKDYGVTSLHTILDMVKVMSFALEEGKVAVHCHAGLGRTGVLIACYLVYAHRMDPGSAILRVRKNRSNSIQTRGQIACINEFWQFLRPLRIVFPQVIPHAKRLTLKQFLVRQHHLLHGIESRQLRYTPKLIHAICNRLSQIANGDETVKDAELDQIYTKLEMNTPLKRCNTVAEIKETLPGAFVNEASDEDTEECKEISEILNSASTNINAMLSPRVLRKGSARSVGSSDTVTRPRSANSTPFPKRDNSNISTILSSPLTNETSKEINVNGNDEVFSTPTDTENKAEENFSTVACSLISNEADTFNPNTLLVANSSILSHTNPVLDEDSKDEKFFDKIDGHDIPDDEIERDVNEILGCNTNNNHSSSKDTTTTPIESELTNNEISLNTTFDDSEENSVKEKPHHVVESQETTTTVSNSSVASQKSSTICKPRRSVARSETILPTGSPIKNPRNSAKGRISVSSTEIKSPDLDVKEDVTDFATFEESNYVDKSGINYVADSCVCSTNDDTHKQTVLPDSLVSLEAASAAKPANEIHLGLSLKKKSNLLLSYSDIHAVTHSQIDNSQSEPVTGKNTDEPLSTNTTTILLDEQEKNFERLSLQNITPVTKLACPTEDTVLNFTSLDDKHTSSASDTLHIVKEHVLIKENSDMQNVEDDEDVEEIIDIGGDSQSSFYSEDEEEYTERSQSSEGLSHSVASRVSWSHMQKDNKYMDGNSEESRGRSAESKTSKSGRRTPLMYRAEKNINLIEGDSINISSSQTKFPEKPDSSSSDDELPHLQNLNLSSNESNVDECLESTTNLSQEQEENKTSLQLPSFRINATRSLNDLTSAMSANQTTALSRCSSSGDMRHPSPHTPRQQHQRSNTTNVALGLSYKLIDDEWLWEKVYTLQVEINSRNDAWSTLTETTDCYLLASLMWTWIEHLAEPILTQKSASQILDITDNVKDLSDYQQIAANFEKAFNNLERDIIHTTKCLLSCILSFPTLPRKITESMVCRAVAALTQTVLPSDDCDSWAVALEHTFQRYVDAKYAISGRNRCFDEPKEVQTSSLLSIPFSSTHDATLEQIPDIVEKDQHSASSNDVILQPAGNMRSSSSSGSSSTGSVVLTTPRIVVK